MKTYFAKDVDVVVSDNPRSMKPFDHENKIIKTTESRGDIFLGFIGPWEGGNTKIKIELSCGHLKIVRTPNYYKYPSCKECNIKALTLPENVAIQRILKVCEETGDTFKGFENGVWNGVGKTKINLECRNGHHRCVAYNDFVNSGIGCRKCFNERIGQNRMLYPDVLMHEMVKEAKKRGEKVISVSGEWKGTQTFFNIECSCGNKRRIGYNSYLRMSGGCRKCIGRLFGNARTLSKEEAIKNINRLCAETGEKLISIVGEWQGANSSHIEMECVNGHNRITPYLKYINNVSGCINCKTTGYQTAKQGTLYIQKLLRRDVFEGVKFGITNLTTKQRMQKQSAKSKFDHEIFYELTLQDGQKILELENKIKEAMKGKTSYISKEDMPDGYTETVAPSELSTIMYIVKSFEKELTA